MYKNAKRGWYKILNPDKFIPPVDGHMKSFNEAAGAVEYKSGLELRAIRYSDYNKHVVKWSCEPFHVKYIKPTDGKVHRYFIDLYMEFSTGDKFIVEIKSSGETKPPKKPTKMTGKSAIGYQVALQRYTINEAKWKAARQFAEERGMKFIILTDNELK